MKNPLSPTLTRAVIVAVPAFILGFLTGGAAIGMLAGHVLAVFIAATTGTPFP